MDILEDFDSIFSNDDDYVKMKLKYFEGGDIRKNKNNKNEIKDNIEININDNDDAKKKKKVKENKKIKSNEIINNLKEDESALYNIISESDKIHIDDIIEKSNIKVQIVTSILMQLEISGLIKQLAGKYYTIEK